jgi:hypothetical protein
VKKKSSAYGENTIKSAFEDLLEAYQIKDKYSEAELISSWEKLLGKTIAKRTEKLFIKDHVLYAELNSAALKHELNSSKEKIIEIFEKELGRKVIRDLVFL